MVWSKKRKGKLPCASPLPVWLVVNWKAFQSRLAGGCIIISAKKGFVHVMLSDLPQKNKVALVGGVTECFPEPCVSTSALHLNHEPNLENEIETCRCAHLHIHSEKKNELNISSSFFCRLTRLCTWSALFERGEIEGPLLRTT